MGLFYLEGSINQHWEKCSEMEKNLNSNTIGLWMTAMHHCIIPWVGSPLCLHKRKYNDWHCHFRDAEWQQGCLYLRSQVGATQFPWCRYLKIRFKLQKVNNLFKLLHQCIVSNFESKENDRMVGNILQYCWSEYLLTHISENWHIVCLLNIPLNSKYDILKEGFAKEEENMQRRGREGEITRSGADPPLQWH